MKNRNKLWVLCGISLLCILAGIMVGSVMIKPGQIAGILAQKFFQVPLSPDIPPVYPDLFFNIRLPRVAMAFLVGCACSVSGAVMQSVLQNPLASPFGLGVSAGAGFGAALAMVFGLSSGLLGIFLMPVVGFSFGLATVLLSIAIASKIDKSLSNNTIVLTGMVLSLFLNAMMTSLAVSSPKHTQRIMQWQLGSFAMKEWSQVGLLFPLLLLCFVFFLFRTRELDLMTFGEEQSQAMGLSLQRSKWTLLGTVAIMTGASVSFTGIIGFVDLISPHIVRRFFGSPHRYVIPASALFGGSFMVLCDLLARTLMAPVEIPIGSITAIIGAPFFVYVYFASRKKA